MVRLLRVLMRVMFRAAAVAALVWIGRELMRRWVNGPEEPKVAGGWETWRPEPARAPVTEAPGAEGAASAGSEGTGAGAPAGEAAAPAAPAKKGRPKKAAARLDAPARGKSTEPGAPVAPDSPVEAAIADSGTAAEPPPAKRRQRPLKATRLPKPAAPAKASSGPEAVVPTKGVAPSKAVPPVKAVPPAKAVPPVEEGPPAEPTPAAGKKAAPSGEPKGRKAAAGPWVSPNGSGQAPSTHPVKAKLISRLYRVPGMPMYNRTVPDRCYTTPEAAEADGFTRAAR